MSQLLSRTLKLIRFLLILLVVVMHSKYMPMPDHALSIANRGDWLEMLSYYWGGR